jgi:hypothetical protein
MTFITPFKRYTGPFNISGRFMPISGLLFLRNYLYLKIKNNIMQDSNQTITSPNSGNYQTLQGVTTTTATFVYNDKKEVESVEFIENDEGNFIEVISSLTSSIQIYSGSFNNSSKSMIKERYGIVDGKIQLIKTISGLETPGHYVPPSTEWSE